MRNFLMCLTIVLSTNISVAAEKQTLKDVLYANSYSIGKEIAEGINLSIIVGMSAIDPELAFTSELKESTFTYGENTWPILDVLIDTESEIVGNSTITYVLMLEVDSDTTVLGTVKALKVDGNPENSLALLNNTMYIETEEGTEQVQIIDGELYRVE